MKNKERKNSDEAAFLRKKAEEELMKKHADVTEHLREGDAMRLIHELEVHQIELELQNEELREAIDKAEAATEKFTTLYDFAPAGYFTLNPEGLIVELNFNAAKLLGKERSSLIKNNFKQFISEDTLDIFQEFYRKVLETESKQICEVKLGIRNHPSKYVYLEGIASENIHNCLITAIDITERQQAEEALKESEARLHELNATKDKFFSIIAHDLRSPFSTIISFSDLLLEQIQKNNYTGIDKYGKIIQESSWRAMNLLMNLLQWAQLQTGKMQFNPIYVDVNELINEVTELLKDSAQQKSITISKEISENIVILADKDMLSNVVRNLVSNAVKFTYPGGKIVISAWEKQDELMVGVSDNGVGIEQNKINKLFLINGNTSTTGTQNEEGTGLGLILCKEFILRHGGKIWVESDSGKGSSFYFTIPKIKAKCNCK